MLTLFVLLPLFALIALLAILLHATGRFGSARAKLLANADEFRQDVEDREQRLRRTLFDQVVGLHLPLPDAWREFCKQRSELLPIRKADWTAHDLAAAVEERFTRHLQALKRQTVWGVCRIALLVITITVATAGGIYQFATPDVDVESMSAPGGLPTIVPQSPLTIQPSPITGSSSPVEPPPTTAAPDQSKPSDPNHEAESRTNVPAQPTSI